MTHIGIILLSLWFSTTPKSEMAGLKHGDNSLYLWDRLYDEQGRKIYQLEGNGVWTRYIYSPTRQWLSNLYTELPNREVLQDIQYKYDAVGNITNIDQFAQHVRNGLGGVYDNQYTYDKQYRLIQSDGHGDFPYRFNAAYSPTGRMGNKYTDTGRQIADIIFGYDRQSMTHQPRTIFDPNTGITDCYWDANGNLAQVLNAKQDAGRFHEWDEENRMRFVLGEKYAGYYGYDGNGERVYKLTGVSSIDQVNSGYTKAQAIFDQLIQSAG